MLSGYSTALDVDYLLVAAGSRLAAIGRAFRARIQVAIRSFGCSHQQRRHHVASVRGERSASRIRFCETDEILGKKGFGMHEICTFCCLPSKTEVMLVLVEIRRQHRDAFRDESHWPFPSCQRTARTARTCPARFAHRHRLLGILQKGSRIFFRAHEIVDIVMRSGLIASPY